MKASEVLKRYATGERNFQRVNLRGQSFQGKNLSEADFSGADIRSAKFTSANLIGANFTGAKCGVQKRWAAFLVIISWLLALISGTGSLLVSAFVLLIFDPSSLRNQIVGWMSLIVLVVFLILFIGKGIRVGGLSGIAIVAIAFTGAISAILTKVASTVVSASISVALAGTVSVAILLVGAIAGAVSEAILGIGAILVAGTISLSLTVIGASEVANAGAISAAMSVAFAGVVSLTGILIGWRAMGGDKRDAWIKTFAVVVAAKVGTNFNGSDLTQADFSKANLKNVDLNEAFLTHVRWLDAQKLDLAVTRRTYLKNALLRQLLVTGEGQNQNYDRQDLHGFNLQEANLENASFIDADFYQANLQRANLSRAILVRANFERADLRGTNLTGSCIQDWVITESTKLDGVLCDRVYLKWIDGDKRDQMPPRGKFKPGGFVTFVRYILETIELYHEKDINPRLALTVLQKMSRDYDEPLDIVALGKKGERVFIQVKVSENIDRENFKDEYHSRYDTDLKLWSGNIHQLPPAVDSFIEKRISEIASEKTDGFVFVDATYVEGNYSEINQGENMSGDRDIQVGRDYRETNVNDKGTYVEGDYHNNPEQKQNLAQATVEIQQLLEQLSKTHPTTTSREKNIVVGEAVDQIENDSTLKVKVVNALKAGGTEAFKEAIDHPLVNILMASIEGWQDAE